MNNSTDITKSSLIALLLALLLIPGSLYAEDSDDDHGDLDDLYAAYLTDDGPPMELNSPVHDTFGEWMLINTQTTEQLRKGALGMNMQHRFGQVSTDFGELFGVYAPANIRLAFTYGLTDRIALGLASTKNQSIQDLHVKAAILRQTAPGGMPVSLSYYGETTLRGNPSAEFDKFSHRVAYHHQLLVSRNFGYYFAAQVGLSYMHFNLADRHGLGYRHDDFALSLIGKVKVTPSMSVIFEGGKGQLLYTPKVEAAISKPSFGLGLEMVSTGHAFQVFVTTSNDVVPGQLYSYNPHDVLEGAAFLGFNITRRWNL